MKKPTTKYLYELPAMTEFSHQGKEYRTITHLKQTVVGKSDKRRKREVLNMETGKAEMLLYFIEVMVK